MRIFSFFATYPIFRIAVMLAACLLICSFSLRSLVVRPSESIHRLLSNLSDPHSVAQLEIDETQDDASDNSPVPFSQRTRQEISSDNSQLITTIKLSGSILYDPIRCERLEISYSNSMFQSLSISPIEKPPKV